MPATDRRSPLRAIVRRSLAATAIVGIGVGVFAHTPPVNGVKVDTEAPRATVAAAPPAKEGIVARTVPATAQAKAQAAPDSPRQAPTAEATVRIRTAASTGLWNPDSCMKPKQAYDLAPTVAQHRTTRPVRDTLGIVSYNTFHDLSHDSAYRDAVQLMRDTRVDVIGAQEAEFFNQDWRNAAKTVGGWVVISFTNTTGEKSSANAVLLAYRTRVFSYVNKAQYKAHDGTANSKYPFPSRWTNRIRLHHRAMNQDFTFLDAHMNQQSEAFCYKPGYPTGTINSDRERTHVAKFAAQYDDYATYATFGVGDLNYDYDADRKAHVAGEPWASFRGRWVSSYDALGIQYHQVDGKWYGLVPTHWDTRRYIDYVFAAKPGIDSGRVVFTQHKTLTGYRSDHHPLLALVEIR